MSKKSKPPSLKVVSNEPQMGPHPSRNLGEHGTSLWNRITSEYAISDAAGIELLTQACLACERAERLRQEIDQDGEVIRPRNGMLRQHPALMQELACRTFVVRTLRQLGLDVEPLRPSVGRPSNEIGWQP